MDILEKETITLEDLSGKTLAVDAFNMLYQFLSTIRQRDGSLLTDSKGNVTSHLTGLFNRVTKLMQKKIKLVFVFDGEPPELKKKERARRKEVKIEAQKKYEAAKQEEDLEAMKKYASRTSLLTKDMVEEAKKLLTALGIPIVQAPCEGEAQAAHLTLKGECYAVVSQDADSLLFKAPLVIKNLNITGKKKKINQLRYETINPELISLDENLRKLNINQDQLIVLAMLVGTDFNAKGIKGIGPKKALAAVKESGADFKTLFAEMNWSDFFEFEWTVLFDLLKNMQTTDDYVLEWQEPNRDEVNKILVEEHDFNVDRVSGVMDKLVKSESEKKQKGLGEFF